VSSEKRKRHGVWRRIMQRRKQRNAWRTTAYGINNINSVVGMNMFSPRKRAVSTSSSKRQQIAKNDASA